MKIEKRRVKLDITNYTGFGKVAYNTAYSIVGQREDAEDIAQTTSMRLLLNEKKIKVDSARNWVITVAKNESYLLLDKKTKTTSLPNNDFDKYEFNITNKLLEPEISEETFDLLMQEMKDNLPLNDRELLNKYFLEGKKIRNLYPSRSLNVKKSSLKIKIYRLRKDIRAEYNKQKGMISSKGIVSFKLNDSITRFIKKYSECIEKKSFDSMSKYFKDIKIPHKIPRMTIKKIIDYDIVLLGKKEYQIYVYYLDPRREMNSFTTNFVIDSSNNMLIKEIPNTKDMLSWHVFDEKDVPEDLILNLDQTDCEGFINVKAEQMISRLMSDEDISYKFRELKTKKNTCKKKS